MLLFKNTNSTLIHSILITFLALTIVCCKPTVRISYSNTSKDPSSTSNVEPKETKDINKGGSTNANKVITSARSYLGTKYKYGGCSKKEGFDCSGLMFTSFKTVNIDLPRTSTAQSAMGKPVKLTDLKPGDLLFFTDKKGNKKITHVGMVTEVRGNKDVRFIHASTKAGVVEDNLYAAWYISIFIKATRIL